MYKEWEYLPEDKLYSIQEHLLSGVTRHDVQGCRSEHHLGHLAPGVHVVDRGTIHLTLLVQLYYVLQNFLEKLTQKQITQLSDAFNIIIWL